MRETSISPEDLFRKNPGGDTDETKLKFLQHSFAIMMRTSIKTFEIKVEKKWKIFDNYLPVYEETEKGPKPVRNFFNAANEVMFLVLDSLNFHNEEINLICEN